MPNVLQYRRSKLTKRDPMLSAADGFGNASLGGVGAQLRAARERLGWALPDVAASLRIRYVHLVALEEGRIADLPGPTYAVGFVRSYAKLLGLDPDVMTRRLRGELDSDPSRPELEFPAPPPERGVPAGVVVLLGAVLAVGAYVTWYHESGDRPSPAPVQVVPDRLVALATPPAHPSPAAPVAPHPVASAPAPAAAPAVPPTAAAAAVPGSPEPNAAPRAPATLATVGGANAATLVPEANAASPQITLRAAADSWVQVRDHKGQVLLNRILRAGESWPVPVQPAGQPPLLLTTGNAGGTELVVDGVAAPSLGASGAVKRDLPLDAALIRDGRLPAQMAAGRLPAVVHPQPAQ